MIFLIDKLIGYLTAFKEFLEPVPLLRALENMDIPPMPPCKPPRETDKNYKLIIDGCIEGMDGDYIFHPDQPKKAPEVSSPVPPPTPDSRFACLHPGVNKKLFPLCIECDNNICHRPNNA